MTSVGITGTGIYVPEKKLTNEWFQQFPLLPVDALLDDSGIEERHVCAPGETGADLESKALLDAVANAGISIEDVELILVGSAIQDQPMPGNAAMVQFKSGAINAAAINVESACTSLLSQMTVAYGLIKAGVYKTIACIASATWTATADYTEKNCMLLGDGAAALILQPVSEGKGILGVHLETDGSCWGALGCNYRLPRQLLLDYQAGNYLGGGREKIYFYVDRKGGGVDEIKKTGPVKTPQAIRKALNKAGYCESDLDFLICHNPTVILVEAWLKELNVSKDKTHLTIQKYGNMSGASIGANLHEAVRSGKIKDGDLVAMGAPGAGYHYASVVMRWGK
ncbi:MAG: hypothetical protein A2511_17980 [Deltaproteobacteria bacterium RIFOXYD12_FULL_50_9]|nr:MAG: hypothetical protein A2511_17980 [Deltaproteobacteria bacterium RIFOXYD12_FULL_50_9]